MEEMGKALGKEALREGISIILGPGVNIQRNPLCGRNFEYYSEDPLLTGEMAASWISGVQSTGVGVSLKHFAGNSQENLRMTSDSLIDERALREIYLPAFERTVKASQPVTVMCAYNKLNGICCSDNADLLQGILRDEWGFTGVIVTDWGSLHDRIQAFKAGLDLEMPGGCNFFDAETIAAVHSGELPQQYLDQSVDRLLDLVFWAQANKKSDEMVDSAAHHKLAREIAAESAVLLKNSDGTLPLKPQQKIAVIGFMAAAPRYQGAGSSLVNPTQLSTALDGFTEHQLDFTYYAGYAVNGIADPLLLEQAVAGASSSDAAVIFAGLPAIYESEGFDRTSMSMPESHNELIQRVSAVQPNTVVVLTGGAPVEMPWLPSVKAVLNMLLPGQAGGLAAVDLLAGSVNPSGKLAATYPIVYGDVPSAGFYNNGETQVQYRESIYVGYRYYDKAQKAVLFPFGHGLSYTTFEYRDLALTQDRLRADETLTVSFVVKNTGTCAGAEVAQVYVGDLQPEKFRPERELRGFEKVFLLPGEEKKVEISLNPRDFSIYDPISHGWKVPSGKYQIAVAASSRDIRLESQVVIAGDEPAVAASGIPAWYLHPAGQVTQAAFETIYGQPRPSEPAPQKGHFSMSSTFNDMRGNFAVKIVIQQSIQTLRKRFGPNEAENPNFRMTMEGLLTTPLRSLVALSMGAMPKNKAQGLVHIANGKIVKGILTLLGLQTG